MSKAKRHWMMKSEPDAFGIDDLERVGTEPWNGVRNYQARNFMRDGMQVGDGVMIYHSNCKVPGIAGLVLSIAMSIDTNVLIYERIREEMREDKGLAYAIERGYNRAFLTVIDSHLTTMSAGLVLYFIGSGPIKGFGLTLMIGIGISLFSGIYVGRLLTDWLCRGRDKLSMSSLFKELPAPYVQWRFISYTLTVLTAVAGNYALGAFLARRGWVDLAGVLVGANLSLSVACAILGHRRP